MRGDIVYRVYGLHEGREKDYFFGAYRNRCEAEASVAELSAREMNGGNWAKQYHNRGFVVREFIVDVDFEIPPRPKPRDKYFVTGAPKPNRPGTWDSTIVEVFRRGPSNEHQKICEFVRHYTLLGTFEPFRQGNRDFALISRDYTRTAVVDLSTGSVIAEEVDEPGVHPGAGFCPVGFYVPDWWDIHDGSIIPGSESWNSDREWPRGDFGFVWGCVWGDDSSWKVQYLDLSRIQQGIVKREERFGYVELTTIGFENPCLSAELVKSSRPPPFIRLSRYKGETDVTFAVDMIFGLDSGKPQDWQRLRIHDFEGSSASPNDER
jgi:hypothetical protein